MNIFLIEDDFLQSTALIKTVQEQVEGAKIRLFETEYQFLSRLSQTFDNSPDLIIIDIMVRWENPSPTMVEAPSQVKAEGYYTAGFRCIDAILLNPYLMKTPIILLTVLDERDLKDRLNKLPSTVVYISKDDDFSHLIESIRAITNNKKN